MWWKSDKGAAGTVDGSKFVEWVKRHLVPVLGDYRKKEKNSILITLVRIGWRKGDDWGLIVAKCVPLNVVFFTCRNRSSDEECLFFNAAFFMATMPFWPLPLRLEDRFLMALLLESILIGLTKKWTSLNVINIETNEFTNKLLVKLQFAHFKFQIKKKKKKVALPTFLKRIIWYYEFKINCRVAFSQTFFVWFIQKMFAKNLQH